MQGKPLIEPRPSAPDIGTARAMAPSAAPLQRGAEAGRLVGLEHLRGVAALLLVYYHGVRVFSSEVAYRAPYDPGRWIDAGDPFSALIVEGHTAIALMLVLSGFVFAYRAAGRDVEYWGFVRRRFARTYPLFLCAVAIGTAVHASSVNLLALAETLFGAANLAGALSLGGFSHLFWAFAIEWQCYLLFPALVMMLNRSGPRQLALLVAMLIASRAVSFLHGLDVGPGLYSQLLGRLDQFMLGMIAGWLYARHRSLALWRYLLAPAVWLLLWGAFAFHRAGGWPITAWWKVVSPTLEGVIWAAVALGYVGVMARSAWRRSLPSRALAGLGAISYSLCLWHYVLIELQHRQGWVFAWAAQPELNAVLVVSATTLPIAIALSLLSYAVLEAPFTSAERRRAFEREPASAGEAAAVPARSPRGADQGFGCV